MQIGCFWEKKIDGNVGENKMIVYFVYNLC